MAMVAGPAWAEAWAVQLAWCSTSQHDPGRYSVCASARVIPPAEVDHQESPLSNCTVHLTAVELF